MTAKSLPGIPQPLRDNIVVRRKESADKSAGGIILSPGAREKAQEGEVIAVGPGKTFDNGYVAPMSLKPGDKVCFTKFSHLEFDFRGQELVTLSEADVIGVVED